MFPKDPEQVELSEHSSPKNVEWEEPLLFLSASVSLKIINVSKMIGKMENLMGFSDIILKKGNLSV